MKAKSGVRELRLDAGKRRATATAGKKARLTLKQRSTRVTLNDGRSASQTLSYRRCG